MKTLFKYPIAELSKHLNSILISTLKPKMIGDIEREIDAVRFKEKSHVFCLFAGGIIIIVIIMICVLLGCLFYHRKRITKFYEFLKRREQKKTEQQGIGQIFRNIQGGRTNGRFHIQETEEEYIIRCSRDNFHQYLEDFTAHRRAQAAEGLGLMI